MECILLGEAATYENFNETGYLLANLDVKKAVDEGKYKSAFEHFEIFGKNEERLIYSISNMTEIENLRKRKMDRISKNLGKGLPHEISGLKYNFLTKELRETFEIIDTDNVSANTYDEIVLDVIKKNPNGLILDCGSGLRGVYYSNVYNYEIVDYITTDIIGVGEVLPFEDETFDAVISIAVLEHVKDPFRCAAEIIRVLKKGATLLSCIPFLQPYHGYPHHYYNMTHQGHENLYAEGIDIKSIKVLRSMRPIYLLTWFVQKYLNGLQTDEARQKFLTMQIQDFMVSPQSFDTNEIVTMLSEREELELASATLLSGSKKL